MVINMIAILPKKICKSEQQEKPQQLFIRRWIQLFSGITRQETSIVIVIIIKIITKKIHNYDLISFSCSFPCPPFALSSIYIVIYYNRTLEKPQQTRKSRAIHTQNEKEESMNITFFSTSKRTLILMMIIFVFWFQRQKKGRKIFSKEKCSIYFFTRLNQ